MPTLEFDLEHVYPDDPTNGIVVSVELTAANSVRTLAHVDTGAGYCLFRSEFADLLGVNLTDGIPIRLSPATGQAITAYGHTVTIRVLEHSVDAVVYFTDDPQFRRNVLGRQGWLHHFKFGLVHYESKLYLGSR